MTVDAGYKCKKCNKVYHKSKSDLPIYCKGCGEELVKERYCYNLTEYRGKAVETRDTNMFGGYDYIKTTLTDSAERVKIRRRFLRWELFE